MPPSSSSSNPEPASIDEELQKWQASQKPIAYVQQIVMKAMVHPYRKDELVRTDAFRGPLASSFKLHLEDLMVYQDSEMYCAGVNRHCENN